MNYIATCKTAFVACAALGLMACAPKAETGAGEAANVEAPAPMDYAALAAASVANPSRPEVDTADDAMRKPAEVLPFIAIEPGMTVLELEAGGGYYTELYSSIVGDDGEVIMQNPQGFDSFLGNALELRLADNRLANVRASRTDFDELDPADGSVDIVTWFLGPHELYFTPEGSEGFGEVNASYSEVMRVLKPGGTFVVLDHAAAAGSPDTTGGTVHRLDPAIVMGLAEAAGFVLVDESDVLRNPDDMYDMGVFDPAVRRKTDRFLVKFQKPE
jgi:predicted methyltransferase